MSSMQTSACVQIYQRCDQCMYIVHMRTHRQTKRTRWAELSMISKRLDSFSFYSDFSLHTAPRRVLHYNKTDTEMCKKTTNKQYVKKRGENSCCTKWLVGNNDDRAQPRKSANTSNCWRKKTHLKRSISKNKRPSHL